MCKNCFEYSEKLSHVIESSQSLLEENISLRSENNRLRAILLETVENAKSVLAAIQDAKEASLGNCQENIVYVKNKE